MKHYLTTNARIQCRPRKKNRLNSSCPDLRKFNIEEKIEKLQQQNKILKEKLLIAETEIENILMENNKLKEQLTKNETKNKYLTQIWSSSQKKLITIKRTQKTLNKTTLNFEQDEKEIEKTRTSENGNLGKNSSLLGLTLDGATDNTKKNNIYIIGDQQVCGLTEEIRKSRSGKWNDNYNVTGIVKPFASSSQVLSSCEYLVDIMTKDDVLVLSVGSNDKNPFTLMSNLCNTLCKLKKGKILILSVRHNYHLNVTKLNTQINQLIKNYYNSSFIDIAQILTNYQNMTSIRKKIGFKINIEINCIKYENDYIKNGLKLRKTMPTFDYVKKGKLNVTGSHDMKKGTIPYYFHRMSLAKPCETFETKNHSCFRP